MHPHVWHAHHALEATLPAALHAQLVANRILRVEACDARRGGDARRVTLRFARRTQGSDRSLWVDLAGVCCMFELSDVSGSELSASLQAKFPGSICVMAAAADPERAEVCAPAVYIRFCRTVFEFLFSIAGFAAEESECNEVLSKSRASLFSGDGPVHQEHKWKRKIKREETPATSAQAVRQTKKRRKTLTALRLRLGLDCAGSRQEDLELPARDLVLDGTGAPPSSSSMFLAPSSLRCSPPGKKAKLMLCEDTGALLPPSTGAAFDDRFLPLSPPPLPLITGALPVDATSSTQEAPLSPASLLSCPYSFDGKGVLEPRLDSCWSPLL